VKKKIKVLVCDDHEVFREGVKSILSREPDIQVVGEAGDGRGAVESANLLLPDVVLMDISIPFLKGFDATRRIKKSHPETKVLILTVYDDEDLVARCLEAGASGYLLKDAPLFQLTYAIREVAKGQRYMSPRVLTGMITYSFEDSTKSLPKDHLLTDREREILVLLAEGVSLKEIANQLNLSVKTVDTHRWKLMRKLDIHDRSELIRYAIRTKLIEA
jgi:DNA-binding NarL/FixJ family response regulator